MRFGKKSIFFAIGLIILSTLIESTYTLAQHRGYSGPDQEASQKAEFIETCVRGTSLGGSSSGSSSLGKVYLLGDSITHGARGDYESALKSAGASEVKINAASGRNLNGPGSGGGDIGTGYDAINQVDTEFIAEADTVIIALGTNQLENMSTDMAEDAYVAASQEAIGRAMSALKETGFDGDTYWVDVAISAEGRAPFPGISHLINRAIHTGSSEGYTVVEWSKVVDGTYEPAEATGPVEDSDNLLSDGIHLTSEGTKKLIEAVVSTTTGSSDSDAEGDNFDGMCCSEQSNEKGKGGSSSGGTVDPGDIRAYIEAYGEDIYDMSLRYNLPYVAILAQSALESGWGQSKLTTDAHNFFGIKADSGWDGDSVTMSTQEEYGGQRVTIDAPFRKYDSDLDGFEDYGDFIFRNPRYEKAWRMQHDPVGYITELKNAGYATDSNYIQHNENLINQFEEEIAKMNDSRFPASEDVKFDPSKFEPIVKQRLAGGEPAASTVGGGASADTNGEDCCTEASTEITGNDNKAKAMSYLTGIGFSGAVAAGIVGNLMQESGPDIDPKTINGTHTGIAQWDNGDRFAQLQAYATSSGKDPYELETQLEWIGIELGIDGSSSTTGHGRESSSYDSLKAITGSDAKAVEEAAAIFVNQYERSGEAPGHPGYDNRIKYALEVFEEFGGSASFKTGTRDNGNCNDEPSGDFVYYSQNDPQWNKGTFPSTAISPAGCGPTSIAMVVATRVDENITPVETMEFLNNSGGWTGLMQWTAPGMAAEEYGLTEEDLGADIKAVTAASKDGKLGLLSGTGAPPFTSGGHIVTFREISPDGKIVVANPAEGLATDREKPEYSVYTEQELTGAGFRNGWILDK